jgi:hypothetical protein
MLTHLVLLGIAVESGAGVSSAIVGLLAGTSGVIYGSLSKEFVFHGRFGSREPERVSPTWPQRSVVVLVSALVALTSLYKLLKSL